MNTTTTAPEPDPAPRRSGPIAALAALTTATTVAAIVWLTTSPDGARRPRRRGPGRGRDRGQATTEYALVMLGAAVVALLVVAWATAGGGAGKIGRLFSRVIDAVSSKF